MGSPRFFVAGGILVSLFFLLIATNKCLVHISEPEAVIPCPACPAIASDSDIVVSPIEDIVDRVKHTDLLALTHWDSDATSLMKQIQDEQNAGTRDKFFLKTSYNARLDNNHFEDIMNTDAYQKEVYLAALLIMQRLVSPQTPSKRKGLVADIGTGSGYKLVRYIAPEFDTVGFETEPAISFLRKTYPDNEWVDSGEPEEALPTSWNPSGRELDLCICADVIEHIRDPDNLLQFLLSLKCKVYVISTPKRDVLKNADSGPPNNPHHVPVWTFHEFQLYLHSKGFRVVKPFDGVQHHWSMFFVAVAA